MKGIIVQRLLPIFFLLLISCTSDLTENMLQKQIVAIQNNGIEAKILLNGGGRMVSLTSAGSENILLSNPDMWNTELLYSDQKYENPEFFPLNGHINWVGPQKSWWTQQEILQGKKARKDVWPPDPYLVLGDYKLVEQTESSIRLIGPQSLYSGVQFEKYYMINTDGSLSLKTEMKNTRNEAVSWDIWFNTRLDGFAKVYVPIENEGDVWFEYRDNLQNQNMPHEFIEGMFTFNSEIPSGGKKQKVAKAFIYPAIDKLFAFRGKYMLVIQFPIYDKSKAHPEHGIVEIFNSVDSKKKSLLELEYHSPYYTLKPNEVVESSQQWHLVEYNGDNDHESHIPFLKNWLHRDN